MQTKKASTLERYNKIRERFATLDAQNKYKNEYMVEVLAKEFFLAKRTIENIIFNRI